MANVPPISKSRTFDGIVILFRKRRRFLGLEAIRCSGQVKHSGKPTFVGVRTARSSWRLGGTTPGSQHDQIHASGTLTLGGTLAVQLINNFMPIAGNSFHLFDAGTLAGTFSLNLSSLAGLTWNTSSLYTTGVLSIGPARRLQQQWCRRRGRLRGVVRITTRRTTLPNDSTPRTDQTDYAVWRVHFGQSAGSGSGAELRTPLSRTSYRLAAKVWSDWLVSPGHAVSHRKSQQLINYAKHESC